MKHKFWLNLALIGILAVSQTKWSAYAGQPFPEDEGGVPEFFLKKPSTPHCVLRVDLPGTSAQKRKSSLLRFIDASFVSTSHWYRDYIPVNIDYVNYKYLHLVTYASCAPQNVAVINSTLNRLIGPIPAPEVRSDNYFVMSAEKRLSYISTKAFFHAFKPERSLAQCTVRVRLVHNTGGKNDLLVQETLDYIWLKYRISVAEVWQVGDFVYVVFARQCDAKDILFRNILEFSAREKRPLTKFLGFVELQPDMREYDETHVEQKHE